MKITEMLEKPEARGWVQFSKILDSEADKYPRFTVIFATNKTLEKLNRSSQTFKVLSSHENSLVKSLKLFRNIESMIRGKGKERREPY